MTMIQDARVDAQANEQPACPAWCEPGPWGCAGDHWRRANYWRIDRSGEPCPIRDPNYFPIVDGKCCNCRERDAQPEILLGVGLAQRQFAQGSDAPAQVVLHCDGTHDDYQLDLLPSEARRLAADLIAAADMLDGVTA